MREKKPEFQIDLVGDPDDVQAMLKVASRVEPAIFKKQWIDEGHLILFYRADELRTDLLDALKRAANQPLDEPVVNNELFDDELFTIDEEQD